MQVVDLGSGAGLPGIPLAIARLDLSFCLSELRRRRVAFIEFAVDSLQLRNVRVLAGKAEDLSGPFDVCLSRAFAEPGRAWAIAESLLSPTGKLLFWAGRSFDVTSGTPEGARISVSTAPELADAGPVVIMTRQ
jgi:16S rRNA (guanine527-N7)-methyltransferase